MVQDDCRLRERPRQIRQLHKLRVVQPSLEGHVQRRQPSKPGPPSRIGHLALRRAFTTTDRARRRPGHSGRKITTLNQPFREAKALLRGSGCGAEAPWDRRGDRGDEAQGAHNDGGMLRADRTQAAEGSVGHWRAVHDLRPVPVHDRDLDRRRRGRHDQAAARHGAPQTHARAPRRAKKPWPPKGPKSPRRDGRRALPCR
jgi:hypothetical protein